MAEDLPWLGPSQELRERILDLLEAHARIGNLEPGHIKGDGLPDLFYRWSVDDWQRRLKRGFSPMVDSIKNHQ